MKPKQTYATEAGRSNPRDCCQTPGYALDPILPYLAPFRTVWEPAAGEGLLVAVLREHGFTVREGDLLTGQDFFAPASEPDRWDVLVTNPPYSVKYDWLRRCYALGGPFALLMPVEVLGANAAQRQFERFGIEIVLMNKRINYKMPVKGWDGAGSFFPSAWYCYGLGIGQQVTYATVRTGADRERVRMQMPLFAPRAGEA